MRAQASPAADRLGGSFRLPGIVLDRLGSFSNRPLRGRWPSFQPSDELEHMLGYGLGCVAASDAGDGSGLTAVRWTFRSSRAEPVENVHDDRASKTFRYA